MALSTIFEDSISTGDILTITVAAVVTYIVYKWQLHRHRFPLLTSVLPGTKLEESPDKERKSPFHLPVGKAQQIVFQATFKVGRDVEDINLRFVKWTWRCFKWRRKPKFLFYRDIPEEIAKVTLFKIPEPFNGRSMTSRRPNTGEDYKFPKPHTFSENSNLWLNVIVDANAVWSGKLSLEINGGKDPRGFGRHSIVIGSPTWFERLDIQI
jgi:hypothetical protein